MKILSSNSIQDLRPYIEMFERGKSWKLAHYFFEDDPIRRSPISIARFVGDRFIFAAEGLLAFNLLRVWQSNHEPMIVSSLFKDFPSSGQLPKDGTSVLFLPEDNDWIRSIVYVAMLFGWEIALYKLDPPEQYHFSHDGWFSCFLPQSLEVMAQIFEDATGRQLSLQ
jgi:hypothetical protein